MRGGGERALLRAAERRLGLFSRAHAREDGISARVLGSRVASGRWIRIQPGVYRVAGAAPSFEQEILAACLWGGTLAVASHRAAGALWGLAGIAPGVVEITIGKRMRTDRVIVHRSPLLDRDRTRIGPVPVTSPVRTLLDLGSVVPDSVPRALDDALRRGLVKPGPLRQAIERWAGSGNRGVAPLRAAMDQRTGIAGVAESLLEAHLLRAIRRARLPEPRLQHQVRDRRGRRIARVDFAYPEVRLAIEADGYRYHGGLADWRRDIERGNRLQEAGWTVLRVTWRDIEHPRDLIRRLRAFVGTAATG